MNHFEISHEHASESKNGTKNKNDECKNSNIKIKQLETKAWNWYHEANELFQNKHVRARSQNWYVRKQLTLQE